MDQQRVNLDGFAVEDPDLGLTALRSPHDPEPSLVVADGHVVELDGVPEAEFDSIDAYIARHGLDLTVAEEAMALSDVAFARLLVDPAVPRGEIIRLSAGATPAKLARVLALLGRGAGRAARADGRERHGHDAQPGILLGQRRADERVRHAPDLPDAADRAGRVGLHVQRVRLHPAL